MKTIQLETTDPAEMQNLLLGKYKSQLRSFLVIIVIAIIPICVFYGGNHSWIEVFGESYQQTPVAFFSFGVFLVSIILLLIVIFVYLESPVLSSQKKDAEDSLWGIRNRREKNQIKLATLLSQIEILKKDSVNVTNLIDQADELKEDILLAEKQEKRLIQCLKDLDDCVVNSFYKYLIYLFKGVKGLKIA